MPSLMPSLMQLVWIAVALLVGSIQIIAAVLFLRHRGAGPWMMLAGASLALITGISSQLISFIFTARGMWGEPGSRSLASMMTGLSLVGSLSHLVFGAGLLITAVRLRGISRHAGQLEQIIGSGHQR